MSDEVEMIEVIDQDKIGTKGYPRHYAALGLSPPMKLVPKDEASTPAAAPVSLGDYAAEARWRKEVGGVTIAGAPVATDDRSKQMIIGARIAVDADPNWSTQWVGADGAIYPVDAAAIIAISNAVQAHVNACFATYASVKAAIDAGTITTTAEIDAAFAA